MPVTTPKALLIIAREGFQDHELAGTRKGLLEAGFQVILGSTRVGKCTGKFGSTEQATVQLGNIDLKAFDRVAFIGGPGAGALAENDDAKALARSVVDAGKILGAICIAPTILAKAGVLKDRKATVWDSGGEQADLLRAEGAMYTGQPVTVDGKIVTGNGPAAAEEFGRVFAAMAS
jgi:protease I